MAASILISILIISNPLKPYEWKNRVLIVFADNEDELTEQMSVFIQEKSGMNERDLVVFKLGSENINPNNEALSKEDSEYLYQRFNSENSSFKIVLIGKDGGVKLEQKALVSTAKLFGLIDKMPMRRQEMKN